MELKTIRILFIATLLVSFNSCYYDVEEELYPTLECDKQDMSYSSDIVPILESTCYQCHDSASNNGNVTIDSYDALKPYIDNATLLGVIKHDPGFSPMPKNLSKLLDCQIEKIEQWILDSALNN